MNTYDFAEHGLPMQPGEASWASWRCGGGPHTEDQPGFQVEHTMGTERSSDSIQVTGGVIVAYAGTEGPADRAHSIREVNEFRANIPA